MPLVTAKCTSCGANLEVDNAKDAAICQYCGAAFVVEKAINNYNITNHNHIRADVVNVYTSSSNDFQILAGRLIKYRGASADAVVPNGVSVISTSAFAGLDCLKSVTIPQGVTVIERYAFIDCINLFRIDIPDSVTKLEADTFLNCKNLSQVSYPHIADNIKVFKHTPFYDSYKAEHGPDWECQFCNRINPSALKFCAECGFENILDNDD